MRHPVCRPEGGPGGFEREHFGEGNHRATTDDFLAAISQTRPTLSRELIDHFEEDTDRFARY